MIVLLILRQNLNKCEPSRLRVMIIKRAISKTICGGVSNCEIAKEFLGAVGQKLNSQTKQKLEYLLNSFTNSWYDNVGRIRNYSLKIVQLATRLREVNSNN